MRRARPTHQVVDADGTIGHEEFARLETRRQSLIAIHGLDRPKDPGLAGGKLGLVRTDRLELHLQSRSDVGNNVTGRFGQVQPVQARSGNSTG